MRTLIVRSTYTGNFEAALNEQLKDLEERDGCEIIDIKFTGDAHVGFSAMIIYR